MSINEAGIIADCKKGSAMAQKALFDIYANGMLLLCKRYIKDNHYAEDVLLNGFYKFFSTIDHFVYTDNKSIAAWLKGIMVNECLMFLRKNKRLALADDTALGINTIMNEDVLEKMSANAILKLINTLPDGYRIIFNLYVIEGYNHREISELLHISESTSKSQFSRAKAYLQILLQKNKIYYETHH